jgi:hypothetical protein
MFGPSQFQTRVVTLHPSIVSPAFLPSRSCGTLPAFETQFTMVFTTDRDLTMRGMRFSFTDRTGIIVPSSAFRAAFVGTASPNTPVNIPNTPAVPIPDSLPFFGMPVSPRSNLVILVNFDCGVLAHGTLAVEAETADSAGAVAVSRASVRVGR